MGKRFNIIYADPPWLYDDARTKKSAGMALSAYSCMSVEDICAIPVQRIADEDCMLLLWCTFPKLKEGIKVVEAWGFKYLTVAFVWVKLNPSGKGIYSGIGHYTNANAEIVLLGRKGRSWREAKNVKQIVASPRGSHSSKPAKVRSSIVSLFGNLPRIELFAREKAEGWEALGNEIDGKHINEAVLELCEA